MKFNRTGQAALEFLTTYGWAFLVILVMIGALAGFGILTPSNFLPNRCNFASELPCSEAGIVEFNTDETAVMLYLRNNLGGSVELRNLEMNWEGFSLTDAGLDCRINDDVDTDISGNANATAGPGELIQVYCNETGADQMLFPSPGQKIKVQVELEYKEVGKRIWQGASGEVYYKII
jgi:hypothetical protein